ncbi:hypothetical protein CAEBREN_21724 [Caenorhabditis brenneri]|uniref:F-box domain-containing protein n=1 Tax=Caenorhabditis brenneri TaxID=135651 RepID=G0MIS0_CAEBE|nr:hypothetical protein CAEBREN_21724 [Caenorhabditis brenneri]
MNRFPLLRLPYLALREVILSTDRSDVIHLALSSRKTCRIINTTRNTVSMQKMSQDDVDGLSALDKLNIACLETRENSTTVRKTIELRLSEQFSFSFLLSHYGDDSPNSRSSCTMSFRFQVNSINDRIEGPREIMRIEDVDVPIVIKSNDRICTLWEDIDFGFQFLSQCFQQFRWRMESLEVNPRGSDESKFSRFLRNSVDFLKSSGKPDLSISNIELMTDSDLQTLLHNTDYYTIIIPGPGRFPDNFACKTICLTVFNADGFTLKHLLNSKCERVCLKSTQMTSGDMRVVLNNWMDGRLETLKDLHVELRDYLYIAVVLTGLTNRTGYDVNRTDKSMVIKRKDGKKAKISIPKDERERKVFDMSICNY